MKNIMVTGGAGFIGANFIHYLFSLSSFTGKIVNVDKLTYAGNPENLMEIEKGFPGRYRFVRADICDKDKMDAVILEEEIDTIVHFAAESHVDRSIVEPDAFIRTNIFGTFCLLELFRKYRDTMALFHHVSTDEVYGSLGDTGYFTETTPYRPSSPYSASKAASDHLVRAYHTTYGLPVTISNCSNNYGPYQFPEKLIPLMILNCLQEKPLPVYGEGKNVRDWLYVTDHCIAIRMIMEEGKRGETYNIGGRAEMKNIDVVRIIAKIMDELVPSSTKRESLITFVKDRPGHDLRYAIDPAKITDALSFAPKENFETGIRKTIQWYLDNPGWVKRVQTGAYRDWVKKHYET